MAGLTRTWQAKVLDHVLSGVALAQPSTVYVGLLTADPGDNPNPLTNEVSGGSYARVDIGAISVTPGSGTTPSIADNDSAITFPQATASWGTVTHWFLADHATLTTQVNIIATGALTASKTIDIGDTPSFGPGDLDVKLGTTGDSY